MAKTPSNKFGGRGRRNKYKNFPAEIKAIRTYLSTHTATATMVSVALDIYRPNLCRHKITLQQNGQLWVTHHGFCTETGYPADYLTCNSDLAKGAKNAG